MTSPPAVRTLSDARCVRCGKLVCRLSLEAGSVVEVQCRGCKRINVFIAEGAKEQPSRVGPAVPPSGPASEDCTVGGTDEGR